MASADNQPVAPIISKVLNENKELSDKPIKIHIPKKLDQYKLNLQYLAAIYQEILLDTCKGKVSDQEFENIKQLSTKIISKLV